MKKLLLSIVFGAAISLSSYAGVLQGSVVTPGGAFAASTTNVFLLSTNRLNVYQIQISSAATGIASFYDSDNTNAPFFGICYTNDTWWTRTSYPSNYPTSFVGQNGITNWATNVVQWTYYVTNSPNTNYLPAVGGVGFTANIPAVFNVDWLLVRGLTLRTTTNLSYTILYNNGQ